MYKAITTSVICLGFLTPAAQAAFSPDSLSDLELWLKADAGTFEDTGASDPTEDGDSLERWIDQSPNIRMTSGTGATPSWQDNELNSLPVVRFDGSNNRMFVSSGAITTDPDQITIFAVVKQDSGDTSQDQVFSHRNSGTELIQASISGSDAILQMRGSGNSLQTVTASGVNNGVFNIIMWQFDTINDLHAVAVNGGTEATSTHDFGNEAFTADTQRIGYFFSGAAGGFLNGDLAELIVFDRDLTGTEKNDIGFYLEDKYGLDTAYIPEPASLALLGGLYLITARRRQA